MSQKYFVEVNEYGDTNWYKDHTKLILHREGGPAIQRTDGGESWITDGLHHRVDGPAMVTGDGSRFWYQQGEHHRVDGPAIEMTNGDRYWYQRGELHRLDGPAVERADGRKEYWIDGKRVLARQFPKLAREFNQPRPKEMTMSELEKVLGHPVKIIK